MGEYNREYVGSYSFSQKRDVYVSKNDQVKIKRNHIIIYEPNQFNVHITAEVNLTVVHFAITYNVNDFFMDEQPSGKQKWACYDKIITIDSDKSKYETYIL